MRNESYDERGAHVKSNSLTRPAYSYFAAQYFPGVLPVMGTCAGTEAAAVFGCAILTSYLFLFIVRSPILTSGS